jgi:transglutaminase-like putative cysteine protease
VNVVAALPPAAVVKDVRTLVNKAVEAAAFVSDVTGHEPIAVYFEQDPDFSILGRQTVSIVLEDAYQTITVYSAELNIEQDTEAPTISGQLDKTVTQGGSVTYRTGITVRDNYDARPTLTVDSSAVKLNTAGTYPIVYTATDSSGNSVSVTGTITVTALNMDVVNSMADAILADLITNEMSEREKAQAIFNWVVQKMKYSSSINPREVVRGAYTCYTRGAGDCYVFFAGYHVLLNRAGIENVRANRIDGLTEHYWNAVKIDGSWYFSDACTNRTIPAAERFLFTVSQSQSFSSRMRANGGRNHEAYKYDASMVPEIVP